MRYEKSITYAAEQRVASYISRLIEEAVSQLDARGDADEFRDFLLDSRYMNTPGFVLRRHIQAEGLVSRTECADLSATGNVPWPEAVVYETAVKLSSISHADRLPDMGGDISTANWEKYLTDNISQGIQRRMLFHLAVVTKMSREETIELLMAAEQAPYNLHEPLELICYFCQRTPEKYGWADVQRLERIWKAAAKENKERAGKASDTEKAARADGSDAYRSGNPGVTHVLQSSINNLAGASLTDSEAEQALIDIMLSEQNGLSGVPQTECGLFEQLIEFLDVLYPAGKGRGTLAGLIKRMEKQQGWFFYNLFQNGTRGNEFEERKSRAPEAREERHVFRSEQQHEILEAPFGKFAMFCKRYYTRARDILHGEKSVDRRDVLLLGYFLITGYTAADETLKNRFWESLADDNERMAERIKESRNDMEYAAGTADAGERKFLYVRILDELLAEFRFYPFYPPSVFDRMILLALMTDDPGKLIRYLMGEEKRL